MYGTRMTFAISALLSVLLAAGAQEHVGHRHLVAPAPGPVGTGEYIHLQQSSHKHAAGGAPAPGPDRHPVHHPWAAAAPNPEGLGQNHDDATSADLLFVLSANKAEFVTATKLQLTGVTTTVQVYDKYDEGTKAGLIKTAVYANGTAGARYVASNGKWLSIPDAALIGSAKASGTDQDTAILLTLSNPVYDAATQSVTFIVAVLPADESALKTHGGVINGLVLDHANGVGLPLLTKVTPGATLTDAALFIDSAKAATTSLAELKDWWQPWGGGRGFGWGDHDRDRNGWNGGWGWGWGGGWNRGGQGWGGGWNRGSWGWGR